MILIESMFIPARAMVWQYSLNCKILSIALVGINILLLYITIQVGCVVAASVYKFLQWGHPG